jgi:hypothetical protein
MNPGYSCTVQCPILEPTASVLSRFANNRFQSIIIDGKIIQLTHNRLALFLNINQLIGRKNNRLIDRFS